MRKLMMVMCVLCLLGLAGCRTVAGIGQDITWTAETLEATR